MKNMIIEPRKKYEYEPKTKEEYYKLFESLIGKVLHEPFPHKPFYYRWYRDEDASAKTIFYSTYSDNFFPFKEELPVEELEVREIEVAYGSIFWKGCERDPIVLKSLENFSLHYSTDPKVWIWDWEKTREWNSGETQLDIYYYLSKGGREILEKVCKKFKEVGVQSKVVNRFGEDELRLRINKNNYNQFRKTLLRLSKVHKIYTEYDYNELRYAIRDTSATIIV